MASFGIPDDVVMQYTDSVVLESPKDHYVREQPGAVLEFADFKRYLVADGEDDGAEYRFEARVTAPITEGGEIVGVRYNGDEEVYGEIVIDATGPAAPREETRRRRPETREPRGRHRVRVRRHRYRSSRLCRPPRRDDAPTRPRDRTRRLLVDLPHRRGYGEGRSLLHPERHPQPLRP